MIAKHIMKRFLSLRYQDNGRVVTHPARLDPSRSVIAIDHRVWVQHAADHAPFLERVEVAQALEDGGFMVRSPASGAQGMVAWFWEEILTAPSLRLWPTDLPSAAAILIAAGWRVTMNEAGKRIQVHPKRNTNVYFSSAEGGGEVEPMMEVR